MKINDKIKQENILKSIKINCNMMQNLPVENINFYHIQILFEKDDMYHCIHADTEAFEYINNEFVLKTDSLIYMMICDFDRNDIKQHDTIDKDMIKEVFTCLKKVEVQTLYQADDNTDEDISLYIHTSKIEFIFDKDSLVKIIPT